MRETNTWCGFVGYSSRGVLPVLLGDSVVGRHFRGSIQWSEYETKNE